MQAVITKNKKLRDKSNANLQELYGEIFNMLLRWLKNTYVKEEVVLQAQFWE